MPRLTYDVPAPICARVATLLRQREELAQAITHTLEIWALTRGIDGPVELVEVQDAAFVIEQPDAPAPEPVEEAAVVAYDGLEVAERRIAQARHPITAND